MTGFHWAMSYLGCSWSATGEGPSEFHCWAFVRHIQAKQFSRDLPEIPNPEDMLGMARAFRDHPERRRWNLVREARDGDCALLRRARYPVHVGVWLDVDGGGVLHCCAESGVIFQRPSSLAIHGWSIEGVYRFNGGDR